MSLKWLYSRIINAQEIYQNRRVKSACKIKNKFQPIKAIVNVWFNQYIGEGPFIFTYGQSISFLHLTLYASIVWFNHSSGTMPFIWCNQLVKESKPILVLLLFGGTTASTSNLTSSRALRLTSSMSSSSNRGWCLTDMLNITNELCHFHHLT